MARYMARASAERSRCLRSEVASFGYHPQDYQYGYGALNAYREENTKWGSYIYILINNGKEARVDRADFFKRRLYSYRWIALSSDPKKDYPHTNTWNDEGTLVNVLLHVLIMGGTETGRVIDHNDGNHYNASRSNLNYVTTAQNNQNRQTKRKGDKATYKVSSAAIAVYTPLFSY